MKAPNTRIENAAMGPHEARQYLRDPILDCESKALISTNGTIIASVQVDLDEGDSTGPVPRSAIAHARGPSKYRCREINIACGDEAITTWHGITQSVARPSSDRIPPILKSAKTMLAMKEDRPPDISIDAAQLALLAEALHARGAKHQGVLLWFEHLPNGEIDPAGAIKVGVVGHDKADRRGALMPMKI